MLEVQCWETAKTQMVEVGITYKLERQSIVLHNKDGVLLGKFSSANEVINFVYGYKAAKGEMEVYNGS